MYRIPLVGREDSSAHALTVSSFLCPLHRTYHIQGNKDTPRTYTDTLIDDGAIKVPRLTDLTCPNQLLRVQHHFIKYLLHDNMC